MNTKKIAALLLAMAMVISILAGCGSDNTTNETQQPTANSANSVSAPSEGNTSEERVTITMLTDFTDFKSGGVKWLEGIEEKLNVNIEIQQAPSSGYEDTLQMMVLSNDRPDMVLLTDSWLTSDVFAECCEDGIFLNIADMLPNYKNIMAHTADVSWEALDIFNDGRIWGVPRSTVMRADGFVLDEVWLNNLGIEYEEGTYLTKDEFFDILYAFTYDDPDGNGVDDTYGLRGYTDANGNLVTGLSYIFGIGDTATWREYNGTIDCLNYSKEMNNYKQYLEFANKCWEAGIIDPDAFSIDKTTAVDRDKSLKHGCWAEYAANMTTVPTANYTHTYVYCPGVVANEGDAYGYGSYATGIWGYWAVTSDCDSPEKALEILDYMLSDEDWINLSAQALEGYNFVLDANGDYDFSLNEALPEDDRGGYPIGRFVRRSDGAEFFINKTIPKENRERISALMDVCFANYQPAMDRGYKPEIASNPVFIEYSNYMIDETNKIIAGEEPVDHWDEVLDGWYEAGGTEYCNQMRAYIESVG